jgi:hypothetical protein
MQTQNPPIREIDPGTFLAVSLGLIKSYVSNFKVVAQRCAYPITGLILAELSRISMSPEPSWELKSIEAWSWRLSGATIGWIYDNRDTIATVGQNTLNNCTQRAMSYCNRENSLCP